MDQNSTNGTGSDKRNWRERLGIGTRDMPKISDQFKTQATSQPEVKLAAKAPQPVTRVAPMAPRAPVAKPAPVAIVTAPVNAPANGETRRAPDVPATDALAEKLKAQRAAAEKLAAQRVIAARERAEARSAAEVRPTPEPALNIPRPLANEAGSKPAAVAPARPKFSFADDDAGASRREPGLAADAAAVPLPRPAAAQPARAPLIPPRPALGGERSQPSLLRPAPSSFRAETPPTYRPADPAAGYALPPSRQTGLGGQRPYGAEPNVPVRGNRAAAKPPAYDQYRRGAEPPAPYESEAFHEDPRGDPRLGRPLPQRGRGRTADEPHDDVFEDEAPPPVASRRRASAGEYQSAYREAEGGYEEDRRRSSGPWLLLLALVAAALITGGIILFYNYKMKTAATASTTSASDTVPVVAAPEQPAKTAAEKPTAATGDAVAPATAKKKIYDRIVGDQEVIGGSQIVPTEVTPVQPDNQPSLKQGTDQSAQPVGAAGQGQDQGTDNAVPLPLPPPPGDNNTQGKLNQGSSQQDATLAQPGVPASKGLPRVQGTEQSASVEPVSSPADGAAETGQALPPSAKKPALDSTASQNSDAATIGETDTPAASTDAKAAPLKKPFAAAPLKKPALHKKPAVTQTASAQDSVNQGAAPVVLVPPSQITSPSQAAGDATSTPAPQAAPQPAVHKKKTIFDLFGGSSSDNAAAQPTVTVEPVPQDTPPETKIASLPATKAPVAPAATGGSGFLVKLASFRSEAEAQSEYGRLHSKYPAIVGSLPPRINTTSFGGSTRYQLGLGPMATRDQAAQICGSLFTAGERDCVVSKQ